jgi:DNA-binding CsgD family transcriptional regulator
MAAAAPRSIRQMTHVENSSRERILRGPHPADDAGARPWVLALPSAILAAVALLVALDLVSDARAGAGSPHLAVEVAIMVVALAGAVALWSMLYAARRRARALERDLGDAREDLARFRAESEDLVRGLGAAIDRQFARWDLSPAEREVALLLLKGLSHKDIATARETSERTVRQQSLAVYRKAGLSGRAELAAFFLEDLLLPSSQEREP